MTIERGRFSVEVRNSPSTTVMCLTGELNALASDAFEAAAARALGAARSALTLDFSATTYVNSTGIAMIVGLLGRARAARIAVTGRGLDDHQQELFEITRLSDFMTIEAVGTADDLAHHEPGGCANA